MADHLDAPTPLDEHRKLAVFAGEWNGDEMVYPSRWTAGGPATSHVVARIALNGFYLIQDCVQTRDGKESFATHGVFTYDREDRAYRLFWHDSLGYYRAVAGVRRLGGQVADPGARLVARQCPSRLRGRRRQHLHHEDPILA
ncbi:hypothetical protein ACVW1C_004212 [Bradyrhizobium sp. USDA 4011]